MSWGPGVALIVIAFALSAARPGSAQEIRIVSEFVRHDPYGAPVIPDRGLAPREILSPAVARNGHLSVHLIVTAPKGTNYFLYAAANPPDLVDLQLYREYFTPCGTGYCPDWIVPQPLPTFGAIPESLHDMPDQNTRCYLLDIHAHAETPPRRVRVEALLKTGSWQVAPLELRLMAPTVPDDATRLQRTDELAPLLSSAESTAMVQLYRGLAGQLPRMPTSLTRLRQISQRNAAEDVLLMQAMSPGRLLPEMLHFSLTPVLYPNFGPEWYLKVRDFLYSLEPRSRR